MTFAHERDPRGLTIFHDWLTPDLERLMLNAVSRLGSATRAKQDQGRAHIFRLGYRYDPPHTKTVDVPDDFYTLPAFGSPEPWRCFDAVTVNIYGPAQGITPHTDSFAFEDEIRILSLGSDFQGGRTSMVMTPGWDRTNGRILPGPIAFNVPRRSLIVLSGEMRLKWKHAIVCERPWDGRKGWKQPHPGDDNVRTSVVYRTLKPSRRFDALNPTLDQLVGAPDVITPPVKGTK